jgi:hypothetical protein
MCKKEHYQPSLNFFLILESGLILKKGRHSLCRVVKGIGFQWMKTRNNRMVLMEKHDVKYL